MSGLTVSADSKFVLKPLPCPTRGAREALFYSRVFPPTRNTNSDVLSLPLPLLYHPDPSAPPPLEILKHLSTLPFSSPHPCQDGEQAECPCSSEGQEDERSECHRALREIVPDFHGLLSCPSDSGELVYSLKLRNLLSGFDFPCVAVSSPLFPQLC